MPSSRVSKRKEDVMKNNKTKKSEKLFFNIILNAARSGEPEEFNDFISGKRLLILYY
jgi:hypothetical protein